MEGEKVSAGVQEEGQCWHQTERLRFDQYTKVAPERTIDPFGRARLGFEPGVIGGAVVEDRHLSLREWT